MKNIFRLSLFVAFLIVFTLATYILMKNTEGATIDNTTSKVVYNLPYPGILPDHPLYIVKVTRDRINEFLTRDNFKKAQLFLLDSDKRASMAISLAKEGKNKMAIDTFSKGEKYALKASEYLKLAKQQGESAPSGFIETAKLSNAKHKELIDEIIKIFPEGLNDQLTALSVLNDQVRFALERL